MDIIIDQEFKELIPSPMPEELKNLEESIKEDGCRDALVCWDDTLVDGYRRHEICTRLDLPYKTVGRTFDNRDQAKIWIIANQLSRRNITPEQRKYLIGIQYKLEKKDVGQPKKELAQNDPITTAEKIAAQHHVSPATVKRAEKFAEDIDKLPTEEKERRLSGKSKKKKKESVKGSKSGKRIYRKNLNKKEKEEIPKDYSVAFDSYYEEITKAKLSKWKYVSIEIVEADLKNMVSFLRN